jgi:DNA-3-methyladenine glycosylase II
VALDCLKLPVKCPRKRNLIKKKNWVGVQTTKIYCRPSCPAKSPLSQNMVYFSTTDQAERSGYRACKRCLPDVPIAKWDDRGRSAYLTVPDEFDFAKCLGFLDRSPKEPCHMIRKNTLYKVLKLEGDPLLLKIRQVNQKFLLIEFCSKLPKKSTRAQVAKFVWNWFDLETNLKPFYQMAKYDPILRNAADKYYGLRIVSISDLFEALCWAIMGQHINLNFAYMLKRRFVKSFGERFDINDRIFYLFPTPEKIAEQTVNSLRQLQLTQKKSQYLIELAKTIKDGTLSKKSLLKKDSFKLAKKELMRLHGVGKWTAEYVCLRCLKDPTALPVDDVGLQNAIKQQLGLKEKPSAAEICKFSRRWKNWQAYAAFYLWNSLI